MKTKEIFIEKMKDRTKQLAIDIIIFCESLKSSKATSVITYQLVKSATSVGANYRAACMARSKREFFSKICIVAEESDETQYWLEIIKEVNLSSNKEQVSMLLQETLEITKIILKAKSSTYEY